MRYAKIIDGQTVYAPPSLMIGEQWYSNPTDEQYRAEGYELVEDASALETRLRAQEQAVAALLGGDDV